MIQNLLYLSDYQTIIYHKKAQSFFKQYSCQNDNIVDFIAYLRKYNKAPLAILVDTAQEEYQTQLLPHVLGKDRQDQLKHKMRRLFERTPYTYAIVQEREKTGRRDDRVLFSALNNQETLTTWINALTDHKIPIIGVYSVPLLSQQLLKYFSLPINQTDKNYLLLLNHTPAISPHSLQGLRQTLFINQQFQLSRLIPLNTTQPSEYADYIINQLIRTQQYLHSKRLLPQSATLSVIIMTQATLLPELVSQFKQKKLSTIKLYPIDISTFLQIDHAKEEQQYLHSLLAHFSLKRTPKNHYATLNERRYFIFSQLRTGLYLIALMSLLSSGAVSYATWQASNQLELQIQSINNNIQQQQRLLEQRRANVPVLPIDLTHFRNVVETGQFITVQHIQHQEMWEKISQVLTRHPNLLLTELEWGVSDSSEQIFTAAIEKEDKDKKVDEISPPMMYQTEIIEEIKISDHFIEGVRLRGKISPFDGNYRVALKLYNDFITDLQQQPAWTVEKTAPPYGTELRQGQIGTQTEATEAPFAVEILVKHAYQQN